VVVTEVAEAEAPRLGVAYTAIQIRDQRTRWGSCSPRGTLTFNWRLVLAPPAVLDYVVVHELCHLREANHGPGFWRLLQDTRPGYKAPRAWLRRHGHELLAYAPPR
jgi:predicted metal-dependent hydrolase